MASKTLTPHYNAVMMKRKAKGVLNTEARLQIEGPRGCDSLRIFLPVHLEM
jgi:hypothetical protein